MYKLGVCTEEIVRDSVLGVFEAMRNLGLSSAQFTYESICGTLLPLEIRDEWITEIIEAKQKTGIELASLNGTFNMISSGEELKNGLIGFENVARSSVPLEAKLMTLCTGTRSPDGMWIYHKDNELPDAYRDLCVTMEKLLDMAHRYDVCLGIEIEASNVISTPEKAKQIIKDMGSDYLKIILDGANLFHVGDAYVKNVHYVLSHAFDVVGEHIMVAHAKDIKETDGISFTSAGRGIIDFDYFADLLDEIGYKGDMLIHGTKSEPELEQAIGYLTSIGKYTRI